MNEKQLTVLSWWYTGKNYNEGIAIFVNTAKNKTLLNTLRNKNEKFGASKLNYVLPKSVGLNYLNMPPLPEGFILPKSNVISENKLVYEISSNISKPTFLSKLFGDKSTDGYPPLIRRIISEYSGIYKKKSKAFKEMQNIPQINTTENNASRAQLLSEIKDFTTRMQELYQALENFKLRNILPNENILWPMPAEKKTMTEKELKKRKKILLSIKLRLKNTLLYNSRDKAEKENPMPEGIQKEKIKLKIIEKNKEIEWIDNQLLILFKNANKPKQDH